MSSRRFSRGTKSRDNYINSDMSDFGAEEICDMLDAISPKFRNGWNSYFFCSEMQVCHYLKYAVEHDIRYNLLVWDRQVSNMISYKFFRSHIDYIVRLYDGNGLNKIPTDNPNYTYGKIKTGAKADEYHPTGKPVELIRDFILLSSNEGDTVLDPFCGGGTTAEACVLAGRNYLCFEINKEHFNSATSRVQGIMCKNENKLF